MIDLMGTKIGRVRSVYTLLASRPSTRPEGGMCRSGRTLPRLLSAAISRHRSLSRTPSLSILHSQALPSHRQVRFSGYPVKGRSGVSSDGAA